MTPTIRYVVNPKSRDGCFLYMKCVDGKHRGKHAWVNKDAGGHTFVSTKIPKKILSAQCLNDKTLTVAAKYTRYYVKMFAKRNSSGSEAVCYYLSSANVPEFEDFVRILGPKEVENG